MPVEVVPVEVVVVAPTAVANRLAAGLHAAGLVVRGSAADVDAAVALADTGTVFVADIAVPTEAAPTGPTGAALVAALLEGSPGTRVLAVAAQVEHTPVLAALRAGAAGFVVHTGPWTALADAVTRAAVDEVVFGPGLAELVLDGYGTADEASGGRLTERESDIVALVVEGLTARQIAVRLVRYAIENGLA